MSEDAALHIIALDHRDADTAEQIHAVLVPAYRQEAALLRLVDAPPLPRSVASVQASGDAFLGALCGSVLCGVLSVGIDDEAGQLCITMLVVDPPQQRRGVGRALLQAALQRVPGAVFAVATGAANAPALALYRGAGFEVYRQGEVGPGAVPMLKLRRALPGPGLAA